MLTEDIIEVKKNKMKYKDIIIKEAEDEAPKKEKKKKRDPRFQRMINKAKVMYPYIKDEDDAVSRWLQDTGYSDHEHNLRQQKEIKNLQTTVADLQDELHELKRTLKTGDRPSSWRTRDDDPRKR